MERIGLAPGTEIGGYRVVGPVGRGGMGAVYRVRDGDGAEVALKLLHPHLVDGPARERLAREVAALQRVRHPAVARVLDAELDSADAFVVTELVEGEDLAGHVAHHGPLAGAELADLAERLREALEAVHAAGVLHRDLTPTNVVVGADGPVLIDFGIAQAAEDARVTTAGNVAGTPGYLSPELLSGGDPDEAADWWGWAATVAFAATGRPPFGVRPLAAVLARVRTADADLDGLDAADRCSAVGCVAGEARRAQHPGADGCRPAGRRRGRDRGRRGAGDGRHPGGARRGADAGRGGRARRPAAAPPESDGQETAVLAAGDAAEDEASAPDDGEPAPDGDRPDDEPGPGPDDEPGWDDDEPDWEGTGEPGVVPPVPPPPLRRAGSVLAIGVLLATAGSGWPGIALVVAVGLAVLARSVGLDVQAVLTRRERRGERRGETARAVAGWPWYLLRAVVGVVPAALVAASAVVVVGGVGWWGIGTGRWPIAPLAPGEVSGGLPGTQAWVERALLVLAVVIGLLLVWFGPMSRATRLGARFALAAVAPPRGAAVALVLLALAAAGVLATMVVLGQDVVWWPLPGPPDLR